MASFKVKLIDWLTKTTDRNNVISYTYDKVNKHSNVSYLDGVSINKPYNLVDHTERSSPRQMSAPPHLSTTVQISYPTWNTLTVGHRLLTPAGIYEAAETHV